MSRGLAPVPVLACQYSLCERRRTASESAGARGLNGTASGGGATVPPTNPYSDADADGADDDEDDQDDDDHCH